MSGCLDVSNSLSRQGSRKPIRLSNRVTADLLFNCCCSKTLNKMEILCRGIQIHSDINLTILDSGRDISPCFKQNFKIFLHCMFWQNGCKCVIILKKKIFSHYLFPGE